MENTCNPEVLSSISDSTSDKDSPNEQLLNDQQSKQKPGIETTVV